MPFKLQEIDLDADFEELIRSECISYEQPNQTFFRLFCPVHGTDPDAPERSLEEAAVRQREWHTSDPTRYWQKVTNDEGKIVGGALWKICSSNPFEHPDDHGEVDWFPEGGQREWVSQALEQLDAPRARMAQRPQIYLNIIWTHPEYRRQGIADMIMDWGKRKADEMGVEVWLDATWVHAVPLYKHGFRVVNENQLRPTTDSPDDEWTKIEKEIGPVTTWQMWRPVDFEKVKVLRWEA